MLRIALFATASSIACARRTGTVEVDPVPVPDVGAIMGTIMDTIMDPIVDPGHRPRPSSLIEGLKSRGSCHDLDRQITQSSVSPKLFNWVMSNPTQLTSDQRAGIRPETKGWFCSTIVVEPFLCDHDFYAELYTSDEIPDDQRAWLGRGYQKGVVHEFVEVLRGNCRQSCGLCGR